jgi:hypothetical protein
MNKQKWTVLLVALALIAGTGAALVRMKTHQKLGKPGIKTTLIPGSRRLDIYLPPTVLDYKSILIPTDTNVFNGLPQDTSFADRRYRAADGQMLDCRVVLMGTDRTSIHKPEFCLTGSGWQINDAESLSDTIRVDSPYPYNLPVRKLVTSTRELKGGNGNSHSLRAVFIYWFVADNDLTERHWIRMRNMSTHLLATGELERWAFVSCYAFCAPGDEARTYDRMKKFIAASVPEFQLAAGPRAASPVTPQASLQ